MKTEKPRSHKLLIGIVAVIAITAVSAIAVNNVHKPVKNVVIPKEKADEPDWDI